MRTRAGAKRRIERSGRMCRLCRLSVRVKRALGTKRPLSIKDARERLQSFSAEGGIATADFETGNPALRRIRQPLSMDDQTGDRDRTLCGAQRDAA